MAGEDFVKLVNENSESTASKSIGGMVGPIKLEDLSPVLTSALATLQPGQITEPIKGPKGYQIYKLDNRAVPTLKPFDTVRDQIGTAIRNERLEPEEQKMLAKLRTQAVIEWKDDKLRQIYEKRVAQQ
jgi:parvulin-like peptidyl-prolyl isomerase